MMRRQLFLWMGFGVLFTVLLLCGNALAKTTYSVRSGDTLARIAAKGGVTLNALKAANHLKGSRLQIGQHIVIPSTQNKNTAKSKPSTTVESAKNVAKPEMEEEEADDNFVNQDVVTADLVMDEKDNSALLGKWNNPDEPKLLVKVAMGFLGAPYRLGGFSVKGIDCSGFVKKIYQFFNIDLPRTAYEQSRVGMSVARDELTEGDLIFFNTRRPVGHVGIYIGNNEFVHACSRKKGVRVDSLDSSYYDRRFIRAVRLKDSVDGV
jgi:peptidoglycan DL-endopeptidase LytE